MKTNPTHFPIWTALLIAIFLGFAATTGAQTADNADSVIPEIKMENVPITTVIENLARTMEINFILDPKLSNPFSDPDGKTIPEPVINVVWTNLPAKQALVQLLKEHNLVMIEDPLTLVTRITYPNQSPTPVDASLLVTDTNDVQREIVFQSVPLDIALNDLVKKAHLDVTLDSNLSNAIDPVTHMFVRLPTLDLHWHNVTAKQAIIALCKNYGLVIVKDPATGAIQIKRKH
jgi:hypothetical protein